jgi:hypothetical protein
MWKHFIPKGTHATLSMVENLSLIPVFIFTNVSVLIEICIILWTKSTLQSPVCIPKYVRLFAKTENVGRGDAASRWCSMGARVGNFISEVGILIRGRSETCRGSRPLIRVLSKRTIATRYKQVVPQSPYQHKRDLKTI